MFKKRNGTSNRRKKESGAEVEGRVGPCIFLASTEALTVSQCPMLMEQEIEISEFFLQF